MITLKKYIDESKYVGKKMHFFVVDDGKNLEGIYVDVPTEDAALKKVKKYIGNKKADISYVGVEAYDKQGRVL